MRKNLFVLTVILLLLLSGCIPKFDQTESGIMDDITFELISKNINPITRIEYIIKLNNNSYYTIVQNSVLFGFINDPEEHGETTNPFRVLAAGNQLNIKPGESVELSVSFSPTFYKEFTESEERIANINIVGYANHLKEENRFEFTTSLALQ
ncbi:hypothetical protein ACIQZG_23015 [Lysinibacillus sp. NPDC096418]|uniref:hypothetical protein n=1 Tax=Lysinibacillus sp. NPDC096418 TaxID=3364138 RepID=UPI00382FFA3D